MEQRSRSPSCAPGGEIEGVFACTRKDRLTARSGSALPGARAARPHRRDPGARVPRRRLPRRAVRARRPGRGAAGGWSASATSCRSSCARSGAPTGRPTRPTSCPRPTATSTSSTASSSTWRARSTTPTCARCSTRSWATTAFRADAAPRALHARRATTPTSAGCSSTRSRWRRSPLETCALHPRLNSDLLIAPRSCTTSARLREFELGAEIALSEEGALLGHVALGQQMIAERARAPGRLPGREAARALCTACSAHHGADGAAGPALRLGRGAGAVPPQRARRVRQGRARARPGLTFAPRRMSDAGGRAVVRRPRGDRPRRGRMSEERCRPRAPPPRRSSKSCCASSWMPASCSRTATARSRAGAARPRSCSAGPAPRMLGRPLMETLRLDRELPESGGQVETTALRKDGHELEVALTLVPVSMSQSLEFNGFLEALEIAAPRGNALRPAAGEPPHGRRVDPRRDRGTGAARGGRAERRHDRRVPRRSAQRPRRCPATSRRIHAPGGRAMEMRPRRRSSAPTTSSARWSRPPPSSPRPRRGRGRPRARPPRRARG